jgi:hypothetical protein
VKSFFSIVITSQRECIIGVNVWKTPHIQLYIRVEWQQSLKHKVEVMKMVMGRYLLPVISAIALFSVASIAADPASKMSPATMSSAQGEGGGLPEGMMPMMPMMPPMPPHMGGICHHDSLFCASIASDNPTETVQKITSILPAAQSGKHYQVQVSVVEVPDQVAPMPMPAPKAAK